MPAFLYLCADDVDATYQRALEAGGVRPSASRYATRRRRRMVKGPCREVLANRYSPGKWNLRIRPARSRAPALGLGQSSAMVFLTFSNGAVGKGWEWTASVGNRATKKPCRITRIGSGRDSPEPPTCGSNPAGTINVRAGYANGISPLDGLAGAPGCSRRRGCHSVAIRSRSGHLGAGTGGTDQHTTFAEKRYRIAPRGLLRHIAARQGKLPSGFRSPLLYPV
jgi:hypothetical protein